MSSTSNLVLPLVASAQAQKHVTINEAFERVDALAQLTLVSTTTTTPPAGASDGDVYSVPQGAVNEWSLQAGRLAILLNGGWEYLDAKIGWTAWIDDLGTKAVFNGVEWVAGAQGMTPSGSVFAIQTVETDVPIIAGTSFSSSPLLPSHASVFAVTGVVTSAITGSLASWSVGITGAADRYGDGIGLGSGSWFRGVTGSPQAYYSDTSMLFSAVGGDFSGGSVRVAVHFATFSLPQI